MYINIVCFMFFQVCFYPLIVSFVNGWMCMYIDVWIQKKFHHFEFMLQQTKVSIYAEFYCLASAIIFFLCIIGCKREAINISSLELYGIYNISSFCVSNIESNLYRTNVALKCDINWYEDEKCILYLVKDVQIALNRVNLMKIEKWELMKVEWG